MNELCAKGTVELAGMIASLKVKSAEVVDVHPARIAEVKWPAFNRPLRWLSCVPGSTAVPTCWPTRATTLSTWSRRRSPRSRKAGSTRSGPVSSDRDTGRPNKCHCVN